MERKYVNPAFPHLLHGADYNPEQWAETPEIWDEDMRLMQAANANEMSVGIFSWSVLEPREGEYDFSFLDTILDKVYAAGGRVILATPSGARPHWMADKYPEVLRVTPNRQRMSFSTRHNHCMTSPVYREKVREMNTRLAARYGHHPAVVAWHLSNEYGGECYCPLCCEAFRDFLRERYNNDIEAVNRAWWTTFWSHRYDSFDQIEPPTPLTDTSIHGLNLDWKRFVTHQTRSFMEAEIAAVRTGNPDIPVTTNLMTGYYGLDYHKLSEPLDIVSWDSYPDWHSPEHFLLAAKTGFWHDAFRCMKRRPFLLMESAPGTINWRDVNKLKRPGMDTLASLQAVAHGSDSVQYFQWRKSRGSVEKFHGAVVDHVGHENTRIFRTVAHTGEVLKKIDEVAGSAVISRVAILFDWENWWAVDDARFSCINKKYRESCEAYHRVLWKKGISVDVIRKEDDFSPYDLLILPMLYMPGRGTAAKIRAYVEAGGTAYATYMLNMVSETDLCHLGGFPGEGLREVFGIWNEEIDALKPAERVHVTMNGSDYEGCDVCEIVHAEGAEVLAAYASEFYAGSPALTVNSYGAGRAYYRTFRDSDPFKEAALSQILADLGIRGEIENLPDGVTAHARYADGLRYLFVENYNAEPVCGIDLCGTGTDLETGESADTANIPAFGAKIYRFAL
ncbi:MAG: beta-galactosidase [Clostridia bacterium]|nr:beta-galactosidase [Clostridia bacterium]